MNTGSQLRRLTKWIFAIVLVILYGFIGLVQYRVSQGIIVPSERMDLVLAIFILITIVTLIGLWFIYLSAKKQDDDIYDLLFHNNNAAIMTWEPDGTVVNINERYEELVGYGKELVGKNWLEYTLDEEENFILEDFVNEIREKKRLHNYVAKVKTKDGYIHMIWNDVYIESKNYIVSFGLDLTSEIEHQDEIYRNLTVDRLTGLNNLNVFTEDINELIENNQEFCVYATNMDNFKLLNDLHGHTYGDEMLIKYAEFVNVGQGGIKAYRWQGDSLLVIQQRQGQLPCDEFVGHLKEFSSIVWRLGELDYQTSLSIASLPSEMVEGDSEDVLMKIDIASHKAKALGKNCHVSYDQSLFDEVHKKDRLQKAIKKAIARNGLKLYLQPVVNYKKHYVKSFEVLLRWPKSNDYVSNIGELISFAEQTGQISLIDKYVIRNTFEMIHRHEGVFDDYTFSINISAQSFISEWFYDYVVEMVDKYKVEPSHIIFEITEYTLMEQVDRSKRVMERLLALGIRVSLDDFGTKFSSLNYLKELPFSAFKIDKSYIDDIVGDEKARHIVELLISLARKLRIDVVAEGVETSKQRDLLKSLSCDYGQGYLHYKPMPIEEILTKLKSLKEN